MKIFRKLLILLALFCFCGCSPAFWGPGGRGTCMWGFGLPLFGPGFQGWFFWIIIIFLIVLAYQMGRRGGSARAEDIELILKKLNNLENEIIFLKQHIKG